MPLVKVAAVDELSPGRVMEVQSGDRTFAVCNVGGSFHCLDGTCPHAGGPLGQGEIQGQMLVCPWHGWEFNCATGANDADEDLMVEKFNVVVQNGSVFADVPE